MGSPVKKVYLLAKPETALEYSTPEEGLLRISLMEQAPTSPVSVVVVEYAGALSAVPYVPTVKATPDGAFDLAAKLAETTKPIQYEPARDCLGYWTDRASATWRIDIPKAGTYRVSITQACTEIDAGTAYTVSIGDQKLKAAAKATGDWVEFKTFELGEVQLATPGRIEVIIAPDQKPAFAVMNLRSIQLVPVE